MCLFETAQCRFQPGGEGFLQAESDVRGACLRLRRALPRMHRITRPAAGAAAVNSQKKLAFRRDHSDSACRDQPITRENDF